MVRTYSVYIHPAPFVRDAIFPHCMLVHVTTVAQEKRLAGQKGSTVGSNVQKLENGEKREALLPRWRLIIDVAA